MDSSPHAAQPARWASTIGCRCQLWRQKCQPSLPARTEQCSMRAAAPRDLSPCQLSRAARALQSTAAIETTRRRWDRRAGCAVLVRQPHTHTSASDVDRHRRSNRPIWIYSQERTAATSATGTVGMAIRENGRAPTARSLPLRARDAHIVGAGGSGEGAQTH